jgi:hypothetical protein
MELSSILEYVIPAPSRNLHAFLEIGDFTACSDNERIKSEMTMLLAFYLKSNSGLYLLIQRKENSA